MPPQYTVPRTGEPANRDPGSSIKRGTSWLFFCLDSGSGAGMARVAAAVYSHPGQVSFASLDPGSSIIMRHFVALFCLDSGSGAGMTRVAAAVYSHPGQVSLRA